MKYIGGIGIFICLVVLVSMFVACGDDTSKTAQTQLRDQTTTVNQQNILQNNQPLPVFNFSQQRASLIQIQTAIAKGLPTWTVFYAFDKPQFSCPSIGFPIPSTTQLTSPEQVVTQAALDSRGGNVVLPQAEPVGTYTGQSTATYAICLRAGGKASPVYWEGDVGAFGWPVKIVNGQVVEDTDNKAAALDIHLGK